METLAAAVLAFYAAGYLILGGADIGAGMLIPFLTRGAEERRLGVAMIVPFFLLNEVWLIATAGLLIALYPGLEGALLTGLFPLVVALLVGWIGRDIAVWFRGRVDGPGRGARAWRAGCDGVIVAGSWTLAIVWSWILAALISGEWQRVPVHPAVLVAAAAIVVLFALHGLAFAGMRLAGTPYRRATSWAFGMRGGPAFSLTAAVLVGVLGLAGAGLPWTSGLAAEPTLRWLVPAVLAMTPVLLAGQVWAWWLFGHRLPAPPVSRPATEARR